MTEQSSQKNTRPQNGGEQRKRRPISRRRKVAFAGLTVLIFLGVVESAARVLTGKQPGGRFGQISQIVFFLSTEESGQILESDPETFWKLRPDVVIGQPKSILFQGRISNSLGYRNEDFELERPESTTRIVCFGDSSTFGIGTHQPQTWPAQLESSLNSDPSFFLTQLKRKPTESRVEVVNAGAPGYTSYQILQRMRRELKSLAPDVVLMTCANNDFWRWDDRTDAEQAIRLKESSWTKPLRYSRAFQLASSFYAKTVSGDQSRGQAWAEKASRNYFAPEESWTPRVPLDEFRANLHSMADLCEEQNVPLVFVICQTSRRPPDAGASASLITRRCLRSRTRGDWWSRTSRLHSANGHGPFDATSRTTSFMSTPRGIASRPRPRERHSMKYSRRIPVLASR